MRKLAPKKRGSRIGFVIDPFRRREVRFESGLEEDWATFLIASPDVDDVREQQTVFYNDGEQRRQYTFDFIVRWRSGLQSACAIKYREDVGHELRELLRAVADANGDSVADDYRILTESDLDEASISNAHLILSCGADFDEEGGALVRAHLAECNEQVCLGKLGAKTGLGERAYRAAVVLVREGVLIPPPGRVLNPDLVVENLLACSTRS